MSKRKKVGIIIILVPFLIFISIFVLQFMSRVVFRLEAPRSDLSAYEDCLALQQRGAFIACNMEPESTAGSTAHTVINVVTLVLGATALLSILPTMIVGIVLIATDKTSAQPQVPSVMLAQDQPTDSVQNDDLHNIPPTDKA